MKTYYECIPCFVDQTLKMIRSNESPHNERVLREVLHILSEADFTSSPPELTRKVFDIFKKYYGETDLYIQIKRDSNSYIMSMYAELEGIVKSSVNPFDTAMRLAIAGNVIDFGANHKFTNETIHNDIKTVLTAKGLDSKALREQVEKASLILYVGDNAGEIVFDKLFINQMPMHKVTFAVRGKPILNDATLEDAKMVGLTDMVRVIDNGAGMPGTVLKHCSKKFLEAFEKADLIISKGQGNYETLSEVYKNVFFLLKVKCPVIARDLGCELYSFQAINSKKAGRIND